MHKHKISSKSTIPEFCIFTKTHIKYTAENEHASTNVWKGCKQAGRANRLDGHFDITYRWVKGKTNNNYIE